MSVEQRENRFLILATSGLASNMIFLMDRLAKESGAGRSGSFLILLVLGLGIARCTANSERDSPRWTV